MGAYQVGRQTLAGPSPCRQRVLLPYLERLLLAEEEVPEVRHGVEPVLLVHALLPGHHLLHHGPQVPRDGGHGGAREGHHLHHAGAGGPQPVDVGRERSVRDAGQVGTRGGEGGQHRRGRGVRVWGEAGEGFSTRHLLLGVLQPLREEEVGVGPLLAARGGSAVLLQLLGHATTW